MDSSTINILIETDGLSKKEGYHITIENSKFQKMLFVFNAINDGWCIKKRKDSYIFSKNHEGKKEVFLDSYLQTFMTSNLNLNTLLH
jgi:hypothetical protein